VLSLPARHLLQRRYALFIVYPCRHELPLQPDHHVPARHVLRAFGLAHSRPLLRTVRRLHFFGRRHAVNSHHSSTRILPAAELDLPERHVLFGRGATDHRQSVQRLPGRELLCVEHALNQGFSTCHNLCDPSVGSVLSRELLLAAGDGDFRRRMLSLFAWNLFSERHAFGSAVGPPIGLPEAVGDVR
jgi:hypothetical protein